MPPPFIRLGSCCNLVKCSLNPRWKSVRSLAYTTCSDVADWSPVTNVLCHPFKVTETLDQLKRERSSALLFARYLKESGFKHDVENYMAIVRLLCHSGMDVRLNNLFMYVIDNVGIEISHLLEALIEEKLIKAVDVLVELYASVGRFEEAMHTLSQMKSRGGLMVSTRTCNFIMNKLIEWDKKYIVGSVYRELKRNGFIPNVYTYGILMEGHCRKGRLEKASYLFKQMEKAGVEPNAFIYGTYIKGLCWDRKTDLAFQVLKNLRESNKPVDVFAYTCVIQGFVNESKLQDAENVLLHDMKIREVVPDADCYCTLIRGYLQEGDTQKALVLCYEMKSTTGIEPDSVAARSMMQNLDGLYEPVKTLRKFKCCMKSGFFLDGVTFNIAIDAACKLGRMEDAMELVQVMKCMKMKPMKMHYRTLMCGYCLRGEPWHALYMFQEMMRNGFTPDSTDYHLLALGFKSCSVSLPLYMLF